jgi:hypothetical protein
MRIQKTTTPIEVVDINKWFQTFNVGSRCEKYERFANGNLNDQYDFTAFKRKQDKNRRLEFFKNFKLASIWS